MNNFHQAGFVIRFRYIKKGISLVRKTWFGIWGMQIGRNTYLPSFSVTWPHQVQLGNKCRLEDGISFKFDGVWKKGPSIIIGDNTFIGARCEFNIRKGIRIGQDSLIASGCKFIDHDHGMAASHIMKQQQCTEADIMIGDDVWLGVNVVVLKGVCVGKGAVVAAGAVVTKSISDYEIWAGIPARKIGERK